MTKDKYSELLDKLELIIKEQQELIKHQRVLIDDLWRRLDEYKENDICIIDDIETR